MKKENNIYETFVTMLKKASNIIIKEKTKTFFDISGYPHYENVISNILAFFFNVTEEHGLKDLWLKSLLECYSEIAKIKENFGVFEAIEREYSTEDNKRLDMVMVLSNAIVAVENKIYANANYNPFDKYHQEILKYKKDLEIKSQIHIVEILLTINKIDNHVETNGASFYNITYKMLIDKIKVNLESYIDEANEKWLIFMNELLKNLENLGENHIMNIEWQKFLKENKDNIKQFINNYREDIDLKIKYMNDLFYVLEQKIKEDEKIKTNISNKGVYRANNSESFKDYFSVYIDILKDGETLVLEPNISRQDSSFLEIVLWNRETKKNDWSREIDVLKDDFPNLKSIVKVSWKKCLSLETIDFEENISIDVVANKLFKIIKKII